VASYRRIRAELIDTLGGEKTDELERLFPEQLESHGRPWGWQGDEVKLRFGQMAGWIEDILDSASPPPESEGF
jgi:hypothetical protein